MTAPDRNALLAGLASDPAYRLLLQEVDRAIELIIRSALRSPSTSDDDTLRIVNLYRAVSFVRNILERPQDLVGELGLYETVQ